jgi:hypothetical protein
MPLARWRDAVGTLDPDLPTREETVQTLLGLARLLKGAPEASQPPAQEAPPLSPWDIQRTPPAAAEPVPPPQGEAPSDEFGFEYARGYDEGYQTGRRVGRALGLQQAREGAGAPRA